MVMEQCPGQDKRFWKAGDIFEAPCPYCGGVIEFWKDDLRRRCRRCGKRVANPRLDLGCAEWCKYADQCLEVRQEKVDGNLPTGRQAPWRARNDV